MIYNQGRPWQVRGTVQDLGTGPLWAVVLWRHHVQSTVLYDHGRTQIQSESWARLLAFDNRGNSSLVLTRPLLVNNEIYKPFPLNLTRKGYLEKMNNLPKRHGAGPPVALGSMQLHQLHRLKAVPVYITTTTLRVTGAKAKPLYNRHDLSCYRHYGKVKKFPARNSLAWQNNREVDAFD